jgi:hypothetical protein
MSQPSNGQSNRDIYLLVITSSLLTFFLIWFYLDATPPTITVESPLSDRILSLFLACIPNIVTALVAFVLIYLFLHRMGINTAFSNGPDTNEIAEAVSAKLSSRLRQTSMSDADIQKLARDITALLPNKKQVSLSNAEIQKLAKELMTDLATHIRQLPISEAQTKRLLDELNALFLMNYDLERQAQRIKNLRNHFYVQTLHSYLMVHNFRGELFKAYQSLVAQNGPVNMTDKDYNLFQNICRFITDGVRASLIEHFKTRGIDIGENVAVTVKLVISSDQIIDLSSFTNYDEAKIRTRPQWVITVFRDTYTYTNYREEREVGGVVIYNISDNTAFRNIYEGGNEYFLHNDLKSLNDSGAYLNENPNWQKYYNASLVVPIQYQDKLEPGQRLCYGFLAADSKNNGEQHLYNSEDCLLIMRQAAELLTIFFLLLILTHPTSKPAT